MKERLLVRTAYPRIKELQALEDANEGYETASELRSRRKARSKVVNLSDLLGADTLTTASALDASSESVPESDTYSAQTGFHTRQGYKRSLRPSAQSYSRQTRAYNNASSTQEQEIAAQATQTYGRVRVARASYPPATRVRTYNASITGTASFNSASSLHDTPSYDDASVSEGSNDVSDSRYTRFAKPSKAERAEKARKKSYSKYQKGYRHYSSFNKEPRELESDVSKAFNAMVTLLSKREHTRAELREKCAKRYTSEAIESALARCIELGYQSEERYAEMLVRHMEFALYGPQKLRFEAQRKGLDLELLSEYSSKVAWTKLAFEALVKKYGLNSPLDYEVKQKALAFLARRGFSASTCMQALEQHSHAIREARDASEATSEANGE